MRENYSKIKEAHEENPRKLTVLSGISVENPNLEKSLHDWIHFRRNNQKLLYWFWILFRGLS